MKTLYVQEQGARLRQTGERLEVVKDNEVRDTVRLRELERVAIYGRVEMTTSALTALLEAGIETTFLSCYGRFRGRLAPAEGKNVFVRREQFLRYEDMDFRLRLARVFVGAKIRNARFVVQKHHRDHPDPDFATAIAQWDSAPQQIEAVSDIEALLGIEGNAARCYFKAFGQMVRSEFAFTTRSRRPPRDPVNALLSFGYALLCSELTGAVAAQGLDPHVGLLHDLDYGRPSLALDLEEEFRQPVVDRLVLSLLNRNVLQQIHFEDREEEGVFLNDAGRPRFLEFYHRTMEAEFEDRGAGERTTFRALLLRQARRIRAAIRGEAEYIPFLLR